MNVTETEEYKMNVVSLFEKALVEDIPDPLEVLLQEGEIPVQEETERELGQRLMVTETQFPDQSMLVLDQQLSVLREKLNRIKYYLLDMDDLLPK